ncbi:hypothetical protein SLA2020_443790 [Shorea laevis]
MTRYFGAHVDDAGIALESSGGLLLLGMIIMSLSIISMVIFACGDDNSGTPPHNGCRNPPLFAPPPGPDDQVGVGDLSSVPGPDEIGGGRGRGRLGLDLRGREVGLGSGMCDVCDDDVGTGI